MMETEVPAVHPRDSCYRCGLRRRTRELEEQGIMIRLCDDCYWGKEPQIGEASEPPAPSEVVEPPESRRRSRLAPTRRAT